MTDYQKIYDLMKAEKLMTKYNNLESSQKSKTDKAINDEKKKVETKWVNG